MIPLKLHFIKFKQEWKSKTYSLSLSLSLFLSFILYLKVHSRERKTWLPNAVIGGDKNDTRSPWGVLVKRLTKVCWHLIAPPSSPDFFGKVGLNLTPGLVTSCCSCHNAAYWRPAWCWLGWGSMTEWPDWTIYWTLGNFYSLLQQFICPNLPHS